MFQRRVANVPSHIGSGMQFGGKKVCKSFDDPWNRQSTIDQRRSDQRVYKIIQRYNNSFDNTR